MFRFRGAREICQMFDFHLVCGPGCWSAGAALRAARAAGLRTVAAVRLCGDMDFSFMRPFSESLDVLGLHAGVSAWAGVELADFPPALLPEAVHAAREQGADLVIVRGEGLKGQAGQGTNLAAIEAGADILCGAGILDREAALRAAEKQVFVEFSSSLDGLANAHVLRLCMECGCGVVCGSSAAGPADLPDARLWADLLRGAAPADARAAAEYIRNGGEKLMDRLLKERKKIKIYGK